MSDAATVLKRQLAEADLAYARKELERALDAARRAIALADQWARWARAMREQVDRLEKLQ